MSTPEDENLIATNAARHVLGAPRVRGYDVYAELAGHDFWSQLSISIGFRPLEARQCEVFDYISSCLMVADPRIWFMRAARITSSFGRLTPGLAAASLLLETTALSGAMNREVPEFYQAYRNALEVDSGAAIGLAEEWFSAHQGKPPGFDTQARAEDERHQHLMQWLCGEPERDGAFVRIHGDLCEIARKRYGASPNFVALVVALMLDMGFSPEHVAPFMLTMLNVNTLNNASEASLQRSRSLREFPRSNVEYVGPPTRKSPRAMGED